MEDLKLNIKQFNIIKKGYDPEEVDTYIRDLEKKVENYQSKESAIHEAIISAQLTAKKVLEQAEKEADQIKLNVLSQVAQIGEVIIEVEEKLKEFQEEYKIMIEKYLVEFIEEDLLKTKTVLQNVKNMVTEEIGQKALYIQSDLHYRGTQAESLENQINEGN